MTSKIRFANHFVAFIDVLGFAEMVRHDTEAGDGRRLFVEKLYEVNQEFASRAATLGEEFRITQFSDSIVVSHPFVLERAPGFFRAVSGFQVELLKRELLCRGGVTYGKHFSSASFMFSDAMISAYRIESTQARYPRIVVSTDLVDLLGDKKCGVAELLVREDDGAAFIDYLKLMDPSDRGAIVEIVEQMVRRSGPKDSPSVQEKIRWLAQYADLTIGTTLSSPRFAPVT
jgi:hypothetical protein